MYEFNLDQRWGLLMAAGIKVVEGRPRVGKHADVAPGMRFRARFPGGVIEGKVSSVVYYRSFGDMLVGETLERVLPGVDSLQEGMAIYHDIPNYPRLELDNGVVAIGVSVERVVYDE